jgi:hypothetical protein
LIIEFVGLPGCGKTTTCRHLAESFKIEGLTLVPTTSATFGRSSSSHLPLVRRKLIAFWRILRSFLQRPWGSLSFLLYGLSSRPLTAWKVEQSFSGISLLPRLQEERTAPRSRSEVFLFDQGIVQLFGSLALPGDADRVPDPGGPTRALVPGLIDGLVWFDCPQETALSRVRSRANGGSRFDAWSDSQAMGLLPVMLTVLEKSVRTAEDLGVPVLRLDSSQPLEDNSARIAAWISTLSAQAKP